MALLPWRKAVVTRIQNETLNTRRFWFKLTEAARFDFIPGQFVTLDLPIHEKINKRWRSYSIASCPDGTNEFELLIVLLEGGTGSTFLFNEVKVGTGINIRGPLGVFVLPQSIDSDLYFICTGTGIAPYRSMLHHIRLHHIPHKDIYLVFGTRTKNDLLYYDEMKSLENEIENFHYLPCLSREEWDGHHGYVHEVYEQLVKEKKKGDDLPPSQFYLCGWKNMVNEAKLRIQKLGYDKKAIRQELYG